MSFFGVGHNGAGGAPSGVKVTTTVKKVMLSNANAPAMAKSHSGPLPSTSKRASELLLATKTAVTDLRLKSTSPPPKKRARTESLEPSAKPKAKVNGHLKATSAVLDVVSLPPSRSASPILRPKYVPRQVAAGESQGPLRGHVEAFDVVRDGLKEYEPFFHDPRDPTKPALEWAGEDPPSVELEYPASGARERFALVWPRPRKGDREDLWDPIKEIMQSIILVLECYLSPAEAIEFFEYTHGSKKSGLPLPSMSIVGGLERAINKRDGPAFIAAIERFNVVLRELKTKGVISSNIKAMPGVEERVWQHVCGQAYDRTVGPRADSLNVYQAWTSNVYGELLPSFVADIVAITDLRPGKICVDLGSGVGNCLIQASLASGCESHGFESMAAASACAVLQTEEAHGRWQMWGLTGGSVHPMQADFVKEADKVVPILQRADVIICNNFVFTAELNGDIVQLLLDAKDGAQVVHLKPFAPATTERSLDSPAAILRQGPKRRWGRKYVSWTDVEGDYYVSFVDRIAYQKRLEAAAQRAQSRLSSRNSAPPAIAPVPQTT